MFKSCPGDSGLTWRTVLLITCCALVVVASLLASTSTLAEKSEEQPIVAVTGGKVQGRFLPAPGGVVFKGIPYAAPPIGDLRWREPQPVKPWAGVRQAGDYGFDCTANHGETSTGLPPDQADPTTRPTSEDCLFLNVWAPEWPAIGKKAVMVWMHGSELFGGTGALKPNPLKNADSSLIRHGVVLVSINYRPHLLGMMGHPDLTAASPHHSSGNYTIFDAIAALRWIHENIARFGGDPDNVTVIGQSGGATITSALVSSPLARGLIDRAIIESGSPATYLRQSLSQKQLEQIGLETAKVLNAPENDPIGYMRGLPASEIAEASNKLRANYVRYDEGIDGYAIPQSPPETFRSHEEARIPIIFGSTAQDSAQIPGVAPLKSGASREETQAWIKTALEVVYGKYPDLLARAEKIYGLSGSPNQISSYPPYGPVQEQLGVDLHHRCAVVTAAIWHGSIAPSYVFEFSRSIPNYLPLHTSELRFVFGYLSDVELNDASAHKLSDQMQEYWTNFAKTGDPNGPGLPRWETFNEVTEKSMDFTNDGPIPRTANRAVACSPYVDMMNRLPKPLLVK